MRHLIIFLLVLVASVWLGTDFSHHPGYVLLFYRQEVVEIPMWLAAVILLMTFLAFYAVLKFFAYFRDLNHGVFGWWKKQRSIKAYGRTQRGLLAMIAERWSLAEHDLIKGVHYSQNPVVNYLVAAEAAYQQKEFARSECYLQKAYQAAPQEELIISLVQAKFELEQGLFEQALATLNRLRKIAPHHASVLKLLEKIYIRKGEWLQLLELLPALRKAKAIATHQYAIFEKNIYCELLKEAKQRNMTIQAVEELWRSMPQKVRFHPDILQYCVYFLKNDQVIAEEIEPLIRRILRKEWNENLIKSYGLLATSYTGRQLTIAESWIRQYGKKSALLLTLARLCVRLKLWGKAREYLEEGLKQEVNSETQLELAKLYELLGETKLALKHYKTGLELVLAH